MPWPVSSSRRRFWGLRTRVLFPVTILMLVGILSLGFMGVLLVRDQTEVLVDRRGESVLGGISAHLQDRQRSKEVFAQLLANERGVAMAVQAGDRVALAQEILPTFVRLGLGHVVVHSGEGTELLHLGRTHPGHAVTTLSAAAISGLTGSRVAVGDNGLEIWAATPIKAGTGIVGTMMVGATLDDDALRSIGVQEGVDLAVFREGRLIASSIAQSNVLDVLVGLNTPLVGPDALHEIMEPLDVHVVGKRIGDDGLLVVLVSTEDVTLSSRKLSLTMTTGSFVLMLGIVFVGLATARDITRPVEATVAATKEMVHGQFRSRVKPSRIRELDALANSFNSLAEQLEVQVAQLAHQAFHDSLTRLPNRVLFMDRLGQALRRADRREQIVALLFLDLDNFKVVNDSLGHHAGDQLLVAVSERLKICLRTEDTAARLGGDEFTVLLEGIGGVGEAIRVAERIQEQLQTPFSLGGHEVFTSTSIGIALSSGDEDRPERLLRDADLAMYRAKANGKVRYEVFDPKLNAQAMERLKIGTDLRRAVERGEFRIHYQPVVYLETGRIREVEALVRWEHPERGLLSPAQFISLAEETGLIIPIGRWVLSEACRQTRAWQAHYSADHSLTVCVNLSARQFQNPRLVEEVSDALLECGLPPSSLKLEITESAVIQDFESTIYTLERLQNLGVQLAVDDFGTGYSSLAYLKRFPVDALKIDKAFVDTLGEGARDRDVSIVRAVIAFAKALNLAVTAEGVETAEQTALLRTLGCDFAQGYYFFRPLTLQQANELFGAVQGVAEPKQA